MAPTHTIPPGARVLYYCHDTYGLGHLRRTLTLAGHVREAVPDVSQLIVTGSPVAHGFALPAGTDYIKLPSVTKNGAGSYEPLTLNCTLSSVRDMRGDILLSAAHHFRPDIVIVDHAPGGFKGEAIAMLRHLKRQFPATQLVLGLRDVLDEASVVRKAWLADDTHELLDEVYDQILVYGIRSCYDVVAEYGLSRRAAARTRFVGYLQRKPATRTRDEIRASLDLRTDRLIVATAGGGKDGRALFDAVLRTAHAAAEDEFDCLLIGGPLLSEDDRTELDALAAQRANVHFLDATGDLISYLAAADAVVSMGGYNSVCEILTLGQRAIIVPRTSPRKEQLLRATFLSDRGLVDMLHPDDLDSGRLLEMTRALLAAPAAPARLPMTGLPEMLAALGTPRDTVLDWRAASSTRLPIAVAAAGDPATTPVDLGGAWSFAAGED